MDKPIYMQFRKLYNNIWLSAKAMRKKSCYFIKFTLKSKKVKGEKE